MSHAVTAALSHLRSTDHLSWAVVGLFAVVVWIYSQTVRSGRLDEALLALAFTCAEACIEVGNGLVLHATGRAPVWSAPGDTSYLIYVGLPIELLFLFALLPLALFNLLPADRGRRIAGLPNRMVVPIAFGLFALGVEVVLNSAGATAWEWWFWRRPWVVLPALAYCGLMVGLTWLDDHMSRRLRLLVLGLAASSWLVAHLVFAVWLGWV